MNPQKSTPYVVPRYQLSLVREPDVVIGDYAAIHSTDRAYDIAHTMLANSPQEQLIAIYMDAQNTVISVSVVSTGTIDSSLLHPRFIIAPALLCNAASIIIAHNHPSGDCIPSPADISITKNLDAACRLFLDLTLHDHIVVGHNCYTSLRAEGHLN